MRVGGASASAFGLRGGIPMDAAQADVYHAPRPESRAGADIARSFWIHTTHPLAKAHGAPRPPSKVPERTRRKKVRKQGATMRVEKRPR